MKHSDMYMQLFSPMSEPSDPEPKQLLSRPKTPYFQFMADHSHELKNMSLGERGKKLGEMWHQLSEEQRLIYKQNYKEQLTLYKQ